MGTGRRGGDGVSQAGGGLSKGREFASAKGLRWVRGQTAGKAGSDLRGEGRDAREGSLIGSRRSCPWSRSKTQTRHAHVHFVCKTSWHGVRDFFNDRLALGTLSGSSKPLYAMLKSSWHHLAPASSASYTPRSPIQALSKTNPHRKR